jgi:hypothetical protein
MERALFEGSESAHGNLLWLRGLEHCIDTSAVSSSTSLIDAAALIAEATASTPQSLRRAFEALYRLSAHLSGVCAHPAECDFPIAPRTH